MIITNSVSFRVSRNSFVITNFYTANMAKVNFYLKRSMADNKLTMLKNTDKTKWETYMAKPLPVIMYISANGRRIQQSLGVSVPPKFWDSKTRRVKTLANLPANLKEVNTKLNQAESNFLSKKELAIPLKKSETPKNSPLYPNSEKTGKDSKALPIPSFENAMSTFMKEHKNNDGFELSPGTLYKYKVVKRHFLNFRKTHPTQSAWHNLNAEELKSFQIYLYDVASLTDNTVTKYIKAMKAFFRFWKEKGLKIDEKLLAFKTREYAATVIVLELAELEKLRTFEPKDPNLAPIKDVFLFMCWTGQRYSDISKIEWKDISTINGAPVWLVTTKKTRDSSITIPLNEIVLSIIEKYTQSPFPIPRLSEQYFNRSLKLLAQEMELNRPIRTVRRIKGIPIQNSRPLHGKHPTHPVL